MMTRAQRTASLLLAAQGLRVCTRCFTKKPLADFPFERGEQRRHQCKDCGKKYKRAWFAAKRTGTPWLSRREQLPDGVPMHDPDGTFCTRCQEHQRFGTDLEGHLVAWCGCGPGYVQVKQREQVQRYDAGEVLAQRLAAEVSGAQNRELRDCKGRFIVQDDEEEVA